MINAHTCIRCRQHLYQKLVFRRGTGFVSLNRRAETSNESPLEDRNLTPAPKEDEGISDTAPPRSWRTKTLDNLQKSRQTKVQSTSDTTLEQLFGSNQRQKPPPRLPYSGTSPSPSAPHSPHAKTPKTLPHGDKSALHAQVAKNLGRLHRRLHRNEGTIQDAWRTWERLLAMETNGELHFLHNGALSDRAEYLARKFIVLVARNRVRSEGRQPAPLLSEVIHKYMEVGILGDKWLSVLWPLLAQILKLVHRQIAPRSEFEAFELLVEVLRIWSALLSRPSPLLPRTQDTATESMAIFLPYDDDLSPPFNRQSRLAQAIVKACEGTSGNDKDPKLRPKMLGDAIEACTITHLCLKEVVVNKGLLSELPDHCRRIATLDEDFAEHHKISSTGPESNVASFLRREEVLSHVIKAIENVSEMRIRGPHVYQTAPMPSKTTRESPDTLEDTKFEFIASSTALLELREQKLAKSLEQISASLEGNVSEAAAELSPAYQKPPVIRRDDPDIHRATTTMIIDLQRAITQHDVARVAGIWQKFCDTLAKRNLDPKTREQIYIAFLTSFWTLSRAQQAVHVWNHMLQAGITPNQKHWNAMLTGASRVRDATSLGEIWKNMLAAGSEPDQA
ncbi:MAG: hypothetical protein Q9174_003792, partial [Haloplaca sp. 1 TL-2023]